MRGPVVRGSTPYERTRPVSSLTNETHVGDHVCGPVVVDRAAGVDVLTELVSLSVGWRCGKVPGVVEPRGSAEGRASEQRAGHRR